MRFRKQKKEMTQLERIHGNRDKVAERLVEYMVRSAVYRGRAVTVAVLRAYADMLEDPHSEINMLVASLQEELDELLGESINPAQ